MRNVYYVLIASVLVLTSVSCSKKQQVMVKNLDVHFEFITEMDEQEYPHTTAYLIVDAGQKMTLKIGEYVALFEENELDGESKWDTPNHAISNYMGWYGGQGVILSLVKDGSQLLVKQKLIEEQSENREPATDITSVIMDNDVSVTVKKAVHKEKPKDKVPMLTIEPSIRSYQEEIGEIDAWLTSDQMVKGKIINLVDESTEGGTVQPYFHEEQLRCFVVTHFGEMGRVNKTYYLLNNGAIFVEVTRWQYKESLVTEKASRQEHFYIIDDYTVYTTDRRIKSFDESDQTEVMNDYLKYKDMISQEQ